MLEGLDEQDRGEGYAPWDRVISQVPVAGTPLDGYTPPTPEVTAGELFYCRAELAPTSRARKGSIDGRPASPAPGGHGTESGSLLQVSDRDICLNDIARWWAL